MDKLPFVTVMMPVRNEAPFIKRTLTSVLTQDYPAELMEIIVADGMSHDATRNIIRSLQPEHSNLKLLDNPGKIVATGLNLALQQARGEIIVRVDGHCEIPRDYVNSCVQHLLSRGVDGVGGPIETIGETRGARAIALAMSSNFGVGGAAFRTVKDRTILVDTVAFPAYTRRAIEKGGPFDEELVRNQDDEYNYRLGKLGGRILLACDIRSQYFSRSSLCSLGRQYFQYGYWKVRVLQKHPRQMLARQFVPGLFVAALLIALFAAAFSLVGAWMLGLLASAYLTANLGASFLAVRRGNWPLGPFLPLAFATLHFAYGCGFLFGLVRFWNRWGHQRNPLAASLSPKIGRDTGLQNG